MRNHSESCLVSKLRHYAELSRSDIALLQTLEKSERDYKKDQLIQRKGQKIEEIFVVKTGWLTSFSMLEDGRRQLLRLFYPGDMIELTEASLVNAQHDIKSLTAAVLCPFPKAGLSEMFAMSPRLTALMFAMAVRETQTLLGRIRAIGRFSAYERLCYLMLEISERLTMTGAVVDDSFRLPLTQSDIADLLGLTNVYVSKTFSRMERDRLVWREGNRVILRDKAKMRAVCEFQPAAPFDTTWLPAGGGRG